MKRTYKQDCTFERKDFSIEELPCTDFDNCRFINSNFSGSDLSNLNFSDCDFSDCNFSNTKLNKTSFQNVGFKNCKMLGVHFSACNSFLLSIKFDNCILNYSSFFQLKLTGFSFRNCTLQEVDFAEANLSGISLDHCDLSGAMFENTNLEKVDFRTSYNYSLDPDRNKVRKARFSLSGLPGLLGKFDMEIE